jgi:transposase InsO family protein
MRSVIDNWREDHNHHRPYGTLGYVPPAVFAASTTSMQTPRF